MSTAESPTVISECGTVDAAKLLAAGPESEELVKRVGLEAAERSSVILYNWDALRHILDRHEDTIRKRWTKKTKARKKTILYEAWGGEMPRLHRPDIKYLIKEETELKTDGVMRQRPMGEFKWPHINLEDLSCDKPMLCLLNTRARYLPAVFVYHEIQSCSLGISSNTLVPLTLHGYAMYLEGETVESYGKLMAFTEDSHLIGGFQPGIGLLILEIQQKIMEFLVKWCETLLQQPAQTLIDQFSVPTGTLAPIQIACSWPTIEILARYTPYLAPERTNFSGLKDFLEARYFQAQDHVWALREDPGYFEEVVYQYADHQPEGLLDSTNKPHPNYNKPTFWRATLANLVSEAYHSVIIWDVLVKQAKLVVALQEQHASALDAKHELPPAYKREIQLLKALLLYVSHVPRAKLKHTLPAAPPIRKFFVLAKLGNGQMVARFRDGMDGENDPLLRAHFELQNDGDCIRFGYKDLVDEMERVVFAQSEQVKRITPLIAEYFSDLGLSVLAMDEINNYHPWAADFVSSRLTVMEELYPQTFWDWQELCGKAPSFAFHTVGTPSLVDFSYPCDQRQSRNNAIAMWRAERNLDVFWKEVDRQYEEKTGRTFDKAFAHRFSARHELERIPEWIEPLEDMVMENKGSQKAKAKSNDLRKAMSDFKLQDKNSSINVVIGQVVVDDIVSELSEGNPSKGKRHIEARIKLDPTAFRAFKALFYTPLELDRPGDMAWKGFLHFMSAMSFSPFKLYGSLWHFKHSDARSIQFHEPLPSSTVSLRTAMRIGRRLKRTYKWHPDMFEKDSAASISSRRLHAVASGGT